MSQASPAVKIGTSRQVVIPKKIHDKLGLAPGDYLQVDESKGRVIFTPKTLVDKHVQARLNEAMQDVQNGRVSRKFRSAKAVARSLRNASASRR
jgi:AbrB family looped-hinge helix DNA binding protein